MVLLSCCVLQSSFHRRFFTARSNPCWSGVVGFPSILIIRDDGGERVIPCQKPATKASTEPSPGRIEEEQHAMLFVSQAGIQQRPGLTGQQRAVRQAAAGILMQ